MSWQGGHWLSQEECEEPETWEIVDVTTAPWSLSYLAWALRWIRSWVLDIWTS